MLASLSPGARWLAAIAGHTNIDAASSFWRIRGKAPVLPVPVPIGRAFHLVRVPVPAAEQAWHCLKSTVDPLGPVLARGHTWDFFVCTYVTDGRDVPGGCLLTGVGSPTSVLCPLPEAPGTSSLFWVHAPDGSRTLTDPKDLALALASWSDTRPMANDRGPGKESLR